MGFQLLEASLCGFLFLQAAAREPGELAALPSEGGGAWGSGPSRGRPRRPDPKVCGGGGAGGGNCCRIAYALRDGGSTTAATSIANTSFVVVVVVVVFFSFFGNAATAVAAFAKACAASLLEHWRDVGVAADDAAVFFLLLCCELLDRLEHAALRLACALARLARMLLVSDVGVVAVDDSGELKYSISWFRRARMESLSSSDGGFLLDGVRMDADEL